MDHLYSEVLAFQHRNKDWIDVPNHPTGQALLQAVQRLEDDMQVRKNPRSIEDQVKRVIQALEKASHEKVMSHHHVDELIDECEDFRRQLKKM